MTSLAKRRSRRRRQSLGKRLVLTERDLAIFRTLARYRYLRSTYLHAFAGGASETRFKERLGDLFHEGYVDRPEPQWQFADGRFSPAIHELAQRGRRLLLTREPLPAPLTFLNGSVHRQFLHGLMICEVLASLELAIAARPDVRFLGWPDILARAPLQTQSATMPFRLPLGSASLVPDALFGLEYSHGNERKYRFFAVEADRGTMPIRRTAGLQTSLMAKLASYQQALQQQAFRTHWGIPNLMVMTVVQTQERLAAVTAAAARELGDERAFLFKLFMDRSDTGLSHRPNPACFLAPYQRASSAPFSIIDAAKT